MKRIVLATALACAAMGASADVTVYGRMDAGLLWDRTGATDTVTMESGIAGASRLGFKGTEKISDDLKVGFVLETTVKGDTGATGTKDVGFFDREAAIYVYSPYGDLRIGRSGALGGGSNGGIFGGHVSPFTTVYKNAGSTYIHAQEARFNNQVRYDSPAMGGLKLIAQYANGGDKTDDTKRENRYAAVGATYKVGDLSLVAVYDQVFKKGDKSDDVKYYKVGAQYKLAPVTFFAGYQHAENAAVGKTTKFNDVALEAESDSVTFGIRVPVGGGNLNMVLGHVSGEEDKRGVEVEVVQAAVGYTYALSKSTTLYAAATYLNTEESQKGALVKETKAKQVMAGLYHAF